MLSSLNLPLRAKAELELRRRRASQEYAYQRFVDPDIVAWIGKHFIIPETGRPMDLYPTQVAALREALARDADGNYRYSTVVWSFVKKSAKSCIAAAVALWVAWQKPWSSIKIIANDLKQAESRVAYYARRAILLHPEWKHLIKVINYKITLPNHSTIEAIPIDPKGEAGGNDDLVIYSEIWGWNNIASQKMWTETTLSPTKFGQSLRWCETYAGFSGESPILEELYDKAVINGECIDADHELYRSGRLFVAWNTKPSVPWQTPEYYAQESSALLEQEFLRVHRNQFSSSTSSFIPMEWWDACGRAALPEYEKLEPWIISLDAAVDGDCFGLVAVTRKNGIVITRHVRKWTPPKGGQIQFYAPDGTPPERDESPAGELARLVQRHSVLKVVYDPYQLHSFCHQLAEKLIVYFEEFPQQTKRLMSDKALRDSIRERHICHDGNQELREHLANANAKAEGDKLRIVKRKDSGKIDLAVCLSMASYEAVRMNLG